MFGFPENLSGFIVLMLADPHYLLHCILHVYFFSDDEICRLRQGHGNTMLKVEGKVKGSQEEISRKDAEIRELKASLQLVHILSMIKIDHLHLTIASMIYFASFSFGIVV